MKSLLNKRNSITNEQGDYEKNAKSPITFKFNSSVTNSEELSFANFK